MNISRFYILIFSVILLSCGTQPVKVADVKSGDIASLDSFFKRSELDSSKAGAVIEKYKIIQHLTHLWKMDRGGKKYYLLEKDDITEMINSVTEGIYLDYILINKNGDIVYTRKNDELFGTNVNHGYEATPLQKCFLNRTGVYFEDVAFLSPSSKIYSLYISSPVYVEGNFHGVLILQVGVNKISGILEPETEILSRDGIIRVSSLEEKVFSKYPEFEGIDMKSLDRDGAVFLNSTEGKHKFLKFSFKEINWIIIN
ncbi:MAG TPA: hypothetical protein PLY36_11970 [Spirochaetota bacterium]|nr:hypothetical protein [Spirochaetota bacterium]